MNDQMSQILHRPCIEYMDYTGDGSIWQCRACGETVNLDAEGEDEDEEATA